ncbi:MAG: 50S ribosomal protein L6 [Phycisphaerales bacterium]|nr:MAG: 50S ribosomal protein L6 [Phycisphaerales bacterium]
MSRIGKKPIPVPGGVTVKVQGKSISVSGPKGSLDWTFPETANVAYDDASKTITVTRQDERKQSRANHGLTRALIANMVKGVSEGFSRALEIYGTGYNCKLQGRTLHLNVGFSGRRRGLGSQFELTVPQGVEVVIEREAARGDTEPAQLVIKGHDKQQVGQFAAEIRALRKTEPYKGKGVRYQGEQVIRKQGKTLTGAAT